MNTISKNSVNNGLIGGTVNVVYGAVPPLPPGATVGGVINGGTTTPYTINTGAAGGSAGQFVTSTSNGTTWATGNSGLGVTGLSSNGIITDKKMSITVPLEVNGRDVLKELDELRDAMLLLKRHVDMEDKYPKLKELTDAYERQLEKYKTFEAIKDSK